MNESTVPCSSLHMRSPQRVADRFVKLNGPGSFPERASGGHVDVTIGQRCSGPVNESRSTEVLVATSFQAARSDPLEAFAGGLFQAFYVQKMNVSTRNDRS